jgi:hypothetical protein
MAFATSRPSGKIAGDRVLRGAIIESMAPIAVPLKVLDLQE